LRRNFIYIIIGFIIAFAILRQCEGKPRTITKTVIKIVKVTDTIKQVKFEEKIKKVYVKKTVTTKGDTVIVYKDKPSEDTTNASQQSVEVLSNNAKANLYITYVGELLDVQGVITYPRIETTTETLKIRDASGLFIYGNLPINNLQSPEVGVLFQIKNKMFISTGAQFNHLSQQIDYKVGIGVKIW
jgi:hypothetical protein